VKRRLLGCDDDAHAFVRVPGERLWSCRRCGVQDAFFAVPAGDKPVLEPAELPTPVLS
jgi:hypothetical protein